MNYTQIPATLTLAVMLAIPCYAATEDNATNVNQPKPAITEQHVTLPPPIQTMLQIIPEQKKAADTLLSTLKVTPAF